MMYNLLIDEFVTKLSHKTNTLVQVVHHKVHIYKIHVHVTLSIRVHVYNVT